jgi:hypothetical protein
MERDVIHHDTTRMASPDSARAGAKAMLRRMLALSGAVLIAACTAAGDSPVTFSRFGFDSTYDTGVFGLAAGGRDLRVVIVGNPFARDRAAFEAAVIDAMQGRNLGQKTNFTTNPGPDANEPYRVVMVFNPPADLTGPQLCASDPLGVTPRPYGGGRLDLFAVFCRTSEVLTQLAAAIPGAEGTGDPLFVELVGQTTRGLFPQRSRVRHNRK